MILKREAGARASSAPPPKPRFRWLECAIGLRLLRARLLLGRGISLERNFAILEDGKVTRKTKRPSNQDVLPRARQRACPRDEDYLLLRRVNTM